MAKRLNINEFINHKFNRLMLIKEVKPHVTSGGNIQRKCLFKCDCGKELEIVFSSVKNSITKSCGCHSKDLAKKRMQELNFKHGAFSSPEYNCYQSMKKRCLNSNHKSFKHYGGRGITISENWINSFEQFLNDMGKRPGLNYSIERINNDLGYSKENCKWATKKEQSRNLRTNRVLEFNGEKKCLAEWADFLNLSWQNLFYKIYKSNNHTLESLISQKINDSIQVK